MSISFTTTTFTLTLESLCCIVVFLAWCIFFFFFSLCILVHRLLLLLLLLWLRLLLRRQTHRQVEWLVESTPRIPLRRPKIPKQILSESRSIQLHPSSGVTLRMADVWAC